MKPRYCAWPLLRVLSRGFIRLVLMAGGLVVVDSIPLLAASTAGSSESVNLLHQGIQKIQAAKYDEALQDFQAAQKADPKDSDALFFQGLALNRLGRYEDALQALRAAQQAGNQNRDLAFEGAWCELHLGHPQKVIALLKRYEQINPGRGQTSEFLGRAYAALGDYDQARAELKEATRRDPNLHPSADLLSAAIGVRQEDTPQTRHHLAATVTEYQDTPLVQAVAAHPPANAVFDDRLKPWSISLSSGAGYNSNVINNGTGFPLPSGVAYKGAAFGEFTVDGTYRWDLTQQDQVKVGYFLQSDVYDGASAVDLNDHFWHADYSHTWNPGTVSSLRVADEYSTYGGSSFRNVFSTRAAIGQRLASWNTLEASYTYGLGSYYFTLPPVDNRSGNVHTLALTDYARIPGTPVTLSLDYYHVFNDAQGHDFDADSNGLILTAASPLFWKITGAVSYNIDFDDYRHPNTFSPTGAKRSDEINLVNVQLARPITNWLNVYARYTYTSDDSNLPFFNYTQQIVSGGLVVQF